MGKGAKPKPTELLKKRGTYRDDRHEDRAEVSSELPATPAEYLSPREKEIWEKWHPVLQKNQILKETDEVAFGILCKKFARCEMFANEFKGIDDYIVDHKSDVGATVKRKNPAYDIMAAEERDIMKMLTEFGMTPASRSKVKVALQGGDDPLSKLRNI